MPDNPVLELPAIRLELAREQDGAPPGFLRVIRRHLVAHYPDGSKSEEFVYDEVGRKALDAAIIAAHFVGSDGSRRVYLRSSIRPPVAFRNMSASASHEAPHHGGLWELPAGLVEPSEQRPGGAVETARRELLEELGFDVPVSTLRELGPPTFPTPGVFAERHYFFEVLVEPSDRGDPELDGSALERGGAVETLPLARALDLCDAGGVEDAKTELGLRRLAGRYS